MNKRYLKTLFLFAALLAGSRVQANAVVVGYMTDGSWTTYHTNLTAAAWGSLSQINYSFATVNSGTGAVALNNAANAAAMISAAHGATPPVRCYLAVGGAGDTWPTSTATLATVASNIAALMTTGGQKFDGVDIDWELIGNNNQTAVTTLVYDLYNDLQTHTPGTPATHGESPMGLTLYISSATDICSYNFTAMNPYIDWYEVPGYDMDVAATGDKFQAALYETTSTYTITNSCNPEMQSLDCISAIDYYLHTISNTSNTGGPIGRIPYGKMVQSMPFYAHQGTTGTTATDITLFNAGGGTAGTFDAVRHECPYTYGGNIYEADTAQSFCDKMNWSFGQGMRGISIWELGGGLPLTSNSMMTSIWNEMGMAVSGTTNACLTTTSCGTGCTPTPSANFPPCGVLVQDFEVGSSYNYFGYPDTLSVNGGCAGQAMAANYLSPGGGSSYAASISGAQNSSCVWGPDFLISFVSASPGVDEHLTNAVSFTMNLTTGNASGPSTIIFGMEAFPSNTVLYSTDLVIPAASVGQTISYTLYYSQLLNGGTAGLNTNSLYQMLFEPRWTGNYGIVLDNVWLVCAPTPTPSPTNTNTFTPTKTFTPTSTVTFTFTSSNTPTPTTANTNTFTITPTFTYSFTNTSTKTFTPTNSYTNTPVNTNTFTSTKTNTPTSTITFTNTPANTSTFTNTFTNTGTKTFTPTNSFTNTPVNTNTFTATKTFTPTNSFTNTGTSTYTPTNTLSPTNTGTPTNTSTGTLPPTNTFTNSFTPTKTFTNTGTPTNTATLTNSFTNTPANTNTFTSTNTPSPTNSFTGTPTATSPFTSTFTFTPTNTSTSTWTGTSTNTGTSTFTSTNTNSPTFTNTPTVTFTPTSTNTGTLSPSDTPTNTGTFTNTSTSTWTGTSTSTPTSTFTSAFTNTSTSTDTASFTMTPSPSFTPTATFTATQPVVQVGNGNNSPSNNTVVAGASNQVVLQLSVDNTSGEILDLNSLTLTLLFNGTAATSTGISSITLWRDPSGNGTTAGSTSLTTVGNPFALSSSAVVNFSDTVSAGVTQFYLVTYTFSSGAAAGDYSVSVANGSALTGQGASSNKSLQVQGAPVNGAILTLAALTATPSFTPTVTSSFTATFTATPSPTKTPLPVVTMTDPYPNPVSGTGVVSLDVSAPADSSLSWAVFTTSFRKVWDDTIPVPEGHSTIHWNMRDRNGVPVSDGLYYIRIQVKGLHSTTKIFKVLVLQ